MLRVGAVSYLNTKPLIRHLRRLAPEIDLVLDVPSQLAADLAEGRLDVGLIPAVEYFRAGNYTILPGASISSFGPVRSVKVCSKVPPADIRRMYVDEGSRTSIALADVILHYLFDVRPETRVLPLHQNPAQLMQKDEEADAVLVIGDRAMHIADGTFPYTLDLGYEWSRWTGLPFVFAFWAVAPGVEISSAVCRAFVEAKELGRPEIPAIAAEEAAHLGIDETSCRNYLEHVIRHDLGTRELAGLKRFYHLANERGLVPAGVTCDFYPAADLVGVATN